MTPARGSCRLPAVAGARRTGRDRVQRDRPGRAGDRRRDRRGARNDRSAWWRPSPPAWSPGSRLAGWLVRRHGPRPLLTGSLALVALGALGFVLGDSLAVLLPGAAS